MSQVVCVIPAGSRYSQANSRWLGWFAIEMAAAGGIEYR